MDRGAWQATVYGVTRVKPNLVTKQNRAPVKDRASMVLAFMKLHSTGGICFFLICVHLAVPCLSCDMGDLVP